jgi:tetratricopeptide (TPR) repeat protein
MFHLGMWRERLRNGLTDFAEGRPFTPPPANIDEINDAELANGIGTPLADAAARSDHLLTEIIELYAKVGDKPFEWNLAKTTTAAVLRNSYTHAAVHLSGYFKENGDASRANEIFENAYQQMKGADAPPLIMATVAYNLACARADQGRLDEALEALEEAVNLRPEMKEAAPKDSDLAPLHDDPRFQELVKS